MSSKQTETDNLWANRIKEYKEVPASEFMDHQRNWRIHPQAQSDVTRESLNSHGIFMTLIAYNSDEFGGLTLLNGHDRVKISPPAQLWPTVILDVKDDEADEILFLIDSIPEMATVHKENLRILQAKCFASVGDTTSVLAQFSNHMLNQHGIEGGDSVEILGMDDNIGENGLDRARTDGGSNTQKMKRDGETKTFTFGDVMVMLPIHLYEEFSGWVERMIEEDEYETKAEAVEVWMVQALEILIAKEL